MRLTFLGSGAAMPTGRRNQSGTLLVREDSTLLVDCGSGVLGALARTDVGYEGVDAVLLTHHHLDHLADLLPLIKALWLAGTEELTVAGPPGTERIVEEMLSVHDYMQDRVDLDLRDVEGSFTLGGFDVDSMVTRHSMECFAYRVTPDVAGTVDEVGTVDEAGTVDEVGTADEAGTAAGALADPPTAVISGDSEAFPELAAFADGATVLAHDCSFPDGVDVDNHPTPDALGEALAAADPNVDRVYLTHLYPHTEGRHEEMLESIAAHYDGDVDFAEDGLTLQLGPRRAE